MEAKYSSETSVDFQRTTRRYIPEDRTESRISTVGSIVQVTNKSVKTGTVFPPLCRYLLLSSAVCFIFIASCLETQLHAESCLARDLSPSYAGLNSNPH
jgi:hypothetical protein